MCSTCVAQVRSSDGIDTVVEEEMEGGQGKEESL